MRGNSWFCLQSAPMVAGCGSISDFSLKDQEWFARPGRMFKNSSTIETPPLSVAKEVTPNDLMSSDGQCAGMPAPSAPADANASTDAQVPTAALAPVAIGHTECDVARAIPVAPDNVNVSANERGERLRAHYLAAWSAAGGLHLHVGTFVEHRARRRARARKTRAPSKEEALLTRCWCPQNISRHH